MCVDKDHETYRELQLEGDPGSMVSKKVIFNIQACQGRDCKNKTEIDEYAKDVSIEQWIVHSKVDFSKYSKKPSYSVMEMLSQVRLEPSNLQMHLSFVRKNDINTNEDWFQIFDSQIKNYQFYDIGRVILKNFDISTNRRVKQLKNTYYQTVLFRDQTIYYHER